MNNKSKLEQFFILMIACVGLFGLFALAGCGGKSCETIKCGSTEFMGGKASGISIPGCGGCLSSGKGCNSCLWPQSCKISCGSWNEEYTDEEGNTKTDTATIKGCDTRYYGDGCLGCGQGEKTCYSGCININYEQQKLNGFFYGSSDEAEKFIGCSNGCGGCVADDNVGASTLGLMEDAEGIN